MGDEEDTVGRTPTLTLTWGGAGLAVAALFPMLSNLGYALPSIDSWWTSASHPVVGGLSAIALIGACVVLAAGLRGETGIAGASNVGRSALIAFGVTHSFSKGYVSWPTPSGDADPAIVLLWSALVWGLVLVSMAALAVAAAIVLRAEVVRGVAGWALLALAATMLVGLLAGRIPSVVVIPFWIGALIVFPALQLATGVLYIVEGQRARRGNGLHAVSA